MTTEKTTVPAIYEALAKVMEGLGNIPRNGVMKFGSTGYNYLRADDVQEKLNPLLIENNVIVKSSFTHSGGNRGRGEGAPFVFVDLTLTYVSTVDGSDFSVSSVGEAAGTDDKSINRALTQAIKNCHRAQFQFPSGEKEADDIPYSEPKPDPASLQRAKVQPVAVANEDNARLNKVRAELGKLLPLKELTPKGNEFFGTEKAADWSSDADKLEKLLAHLKTGEV